MSSTQQPARRRRIALAATVLAAALTVSVVLLTTGQDGPSAKSDAPSAAVSTPGPDASSDQKPDLSSLARRKADDPMALGRTDAPVVLIEYADFQCPFCGRFARETQPALIRDYLKKGVLRVEWRNFPVFGKESDRAALAGWAAGRQGKFWKFHELLYSQPRERNSGVFTSDHLVDFAREAGVKDLERFRTDMNSETARDAVRRDKDEGYRLGVTSTPAFLVNDTPILGAMPTPTFEKAIEKAAKEARR